MRKLFLLLFIAILFSCDNKEKHYGDWIYDYRYSTIASDVPSRIKINKDSIKFRYPYFNHWNSFPLKLSSNKLEFNGLTFKTNFNKDTLSLNKHFKLIKLFSSIESNLLLAELNFVNINLPKSNFINESENGNENFLVRYGKRIDNGQYVLNLNDKYAEFDDLLSFLSSSHSRHEYMNSVLLFCDKNTELRVLEKMLFKFQISSKHKISFVNDISINNKIYEPFYSYSTLKLKMIPYNENDIYFLNLNENIPLPSSPPIPSISESNYIILKLINNKVYEDKKELNKSALKALIEESIKDGKFIITLYDLDSDYYSFIKMNGIINLSYQNLRNDKALIKHNKAFNTLNIEEQRSIRQEIPNKNIWHYSIPHFNSLIKQNGNFLGLKLKTINLK